MVCWARRLLELAALAPLVCALLPTPSLPSRATQSKAVARPQFLNARTTSHHHIHGPFLAPLGRAQSKRRSTVLAAGHGETGAEDVAERRKRRLRDHLGSAPDGSPGQPPPSSSAPPAPAPPAPAPPTGPTPAQLARQQAQQARKELPPTDALAQLTNKELKALAVKCAVSTTGCLEKADIVSRLEKAKSGDEPFSATTASNGASTGASNSNSSPGSSSSSIGGGGGSSSAGSSSSSVGSGGGNTATNAATAAPASPGAAGGGSAGGVSAADLDSLSVRDLRTMIHLAGLSSRGLLEKPEFLARAREAKAILDSRPQFPDAERYKELGVKFFGRRTCPHCVSALEVLESRGLSDMLDVEADAAAGDEFRKVNAGAAGAGVPFFYSSTTGKSLAGWRPGVKDVDWIVNALS